MTPDDQHRRYIDSHPTPCPALEAHAEVMDGIFQKLESIEKCQKDTIEMLAAWNNAKGFVTTMKTFGVLILWIVGIIAGVTALIEVVRHWLIGK